ncbi:MAG: transcription-repair coupling factor [Deltaproteobacteria bacterium]|nr:transcription-repair coupling factor [Deltaproteobacteria bacterium]
MEPAPPRHLDELLERVLARAGPVRVTGLRGAARALVAARLARASAPGPALVVAPDAKAADALLDDLTAFLGEPPPEEGGRVRAFPRPDTLPYDRHSPQPFVVAQRMDALYRLLAEPAELVLVAPVTALALRVPSREAVRGRTVHLEVGQTIDRDALVEQLLAAGYARMPLVEERGELAVRGGIVDLFPPHRRRPVRIELLGDDVESIREFDAASQRSQEKLVHVAAPPPRELLLDRGLLIARGEEIRARVEHEGASPREIDALLDALLRGHLPPGAEALAPVLAPGLETPFDWLPPGTLVAIEEPEACRERLARFAEEAAHGHRVAREAARPVAPPGELLLAPGAVWAALDRLRSVSLERLDVADDTGVPRLALRTADHDELRRELVRARAGDAALLPLVTRLEGWLRERWRVVLAAPALSGAERLRQLLAEYGLDPKLVRDARPVPAWGRSGRVEVRVAGVSEGFALPGERFALVTEEEVFGPRERRRHHLSIRETAAIEGLGQLQPGDPLVHHEHGIGIYRGLVSLALDLRGAGPRVEGEFLRLEYEGGDRLFVPVHRLNLVQRYVGAEGVAPKLDKLGGQSWEKTRRQVKGSLRDMARELLGLHAARELAEGFAFSPRDRALEEFEAAFPYEETPDQHAAIEDVLADMQRPKPMDRLVCGDVGFGKTEVAIRAAFQAVSAGKQVAVLVPTTVLCAQHEETFRRRFDGHPVRIESLSRFRTPKDARAVLEGLRSGRVDIVIGTHRLLQKHVEFRDLGLLVVDEEHRFGVADKERIKRLRKTVDVLTLTATPIPRTLQLAFAGLRDLSVIHTPPADRLSIRTQVARWSESLIREAVLREVRRGGQVFFVHNRVHSIGEIAEMLARVVPEVRVVVAHGQMGERELEARMLRFLHGEADLLLSTTIIESGLDVGRANTMLVDRADHFGLAQLYQLRGRIGRSHHRAYCYLLVRGAERTLSDDAKKRLEAIQSFTELGSGFKLASMDLEIRGAGNLLGAEQSGNLAAVGFDAYMELLEETVEELRGRARPPAVDPEIRLPVAARLPDDYVPDVSQRLVLYKRLASAPDEADVDRIRDELLDRFGPCPPETANLLAVIRLKIAARRLGVAAVDLAGDQIVLTAAETTRIDPRRLVNLLTHPTAGIRVAPNHRIYAPVAGDARDPEHLFGAAHALLGQLAA